MLKHGPRLKVRPYEPEDWETLHRWYTSGDYPEFFRDVVGVMNKEQVKQYGAAADRMTFIIEYAGVRSIGLILVFNWRLMASIADIAILIDKKEQGKGYFLESLTITTDYLFNGMRLWKLVCNVLRTNARLRSMILKCGFKQEAVFKNEAFLNGEHVDVVRYFIERPKAAKQLKIAWEDLCQEKEKRLGSPPLSLAQ